MRRLRAAGLLGVALLMCLLLIPTPVLAKKKTKIKKISFKKYEKNLTIYQGKTKKLKLKITPSKAKKNKVKWYSSKKSVVSVTQKGVIQGLKAGTSTITVKAKDGSKVKAKLKVRVIVPVEQITFTNAEKCPELAVRKTFTLKTAITPANASIKTLEWSSSDSDIAAVSQKGKVTAVSNGTVTITAKATDGTGRKVSTRIRVYTPVSKVVLALKNESPYLTKWGNGVFMKIGTSGSLDPTISPSSASNKTLSYVSSNPDVVSVTAKGKITARACGSAQITATATDGTGKHDSFYVHVARLTKADCSFTTHRGRSEIAPGNSPAAIRLALESNFDSLELDIRVTKDQEFLIAHDENLERICGEDVDVSDITLAEGMKKTIIYGNGLDQYPNEKLASLEQILTLAEKYPDKSLTIEIKPLLSQEMAEKLLTTIRDHHMEDNVKLISFLKGNLSLIRKLTDLGGDTIAMGYLVKEVTPKAVTTCISLQAGLCANYKSLTEAAVTDMHDAGLPVSVYSLPNFITAYHMVHTMKVDGFSSDYCFLN